MNQQPIFRFTPFGAKAPERAVACDGLVPGAALDLSHWPRNRTPQTLKRDTSVEIALTFAEQALDEFLVVTNNHFDTDGLLAVWALLAPEEAKALAPLIIAAAEAGDFEEWPMDERGLWLDLALSRLSRGLGNETAQYQTLLPQVGALARTIERREDLWGNDFAALQQSLERAKAGELVVSRVGPITVFIQERGKPELPGVVLSRLAPVGTSRWLMAFAEGEGRYSYRYGLPPWAWADTVVRPRLTPPRRGALVAGLPGKWVIRAPGGMATLTRTEGSVALSPTALAECLWSQDSQCNALPVDNLQ